MTSNDRAKIESRLNCKLSYKEIAENIHKSATTVSREIAKHAIIDRSGACYRGFNNCIHRENCPMSFASDKHKDWTIQVRDASTARLSVAHLNTSCMSRKYARP